MSNTASTTTRLAELNDQFASVRAKYDLATQDRDWSSCNAFAAEMNDIKHQIAEVNDEIANEQPDDGWDDNEDPTLDDAAYWASLHEREDGDEDRYLDGSWEDANEYGMEGCCGDF